MYKFTEKQKVKYRRTGEHCVSVVSVIAGSPFESHARIPSVGTRAAFTVTPMPRIDASKFLLPPFPLSPCINWPPSLYESIKVATVRWFFLFFLLRARVYETTIATDIIVGTLINNINVAYDCGSSFFFLRSSSLFFHLVARENDNRGFLRRFGHSEGLTRFIKSLG